MLDALLNQMVLARLQVDEKSFIRSRTCTGKVIVGQHQGFLRIFPNMNQIFPQGNAQEGKVFHPILLISHKEQVIGLLIFRENKLFLPELGNG